jgi:hypothetical protein
MDPDLDRKNFKALTGAMEGRGHTMEARNGAVGVCKPAVVDSHYFDEEQKKTDPDLHLNEKSDPNPHKK